MSEVKEVLAGEKSPEYWEGYEKCRADREKEQDYEAQFKLAERRRLLVALAAGYMSGAFNTEQAENLLVEIDARLDAEGGKL